MDISLNALGDINSAILGDTVAFESAGFELGGGTYVTQRMLASHFADDNGESWTSVFGNADSAGVSEMSEQELVAYIANKRHANDEWRSGLVKLSTKGLLTEYLNAKAETNYLLEKIAEQEMKLMAQEALLARVRMNHKDKTPVKRREIIKKTATTKRNTPFSDEKRGVSLRQLHPENPS